MSACRCEHELANPDRDADEAASSAWGTSSHSRNDSCVATSHVFCTHHSVCLKCLGLSRFLLFLFQEPPLSDFHLPILLSFFNGVLFLPRNWTYLECAAALGFSCVSPEPVRVSGICFLFKIGSWIFKDKISPLIYIKWSVKQDHNSKVGKPSVKDQNLCTSFLFKLTGLQASSISTRSQPSASHSLRLLQDLPVLGGSFRKHLGFLTWLLPCNLWKGISLSFCSP